MPNKNTSCGQALCYTLLFGCLLTGCATVTPAASQPPLVVNVAQDKTPFYQALNRLVLPAKTPQPAPQGVADGIYKGVTDNGETFTTFIKNGYFDELLVIYYPNFVTQLRADLVNGLYDGWVTYRLPTGVTQQKVLFDQGVVQEAIIYNQFDKPEFHFWFKDEQPTSGMRYDNNGVAVESMF